MNNFLSVDTAANSPSTTKSIMSIIDNIKNSEFWKSSESRAAIFVTGILVVIAIFLVFNYYQKTNNTENEIGQTTNESTNTEESESTSTENAKDTTNTEETNAYIVKEGDTLWSIAENELKDPYRWTELKDLNEMTSSEVEPGQMLILPSQTTDSTKTQEVAKKDTENTGEVLSDTTSKETPATYTVQAGDTLWDIDEKVYGNPYEWTKIFDANELGRLPNGNVLIHRGNVLVIPALN